MKKIFLAAAYCILIAAPFFAKPKDDSLSLAEIDRLIRETDYDAALSALYEFNVSHPERFEDMQRRVGKIIKKLNLYTATASQLFDTVENDPENGEKILAIIAKLESLKKNPTEQQLSFIREARSAAQFTMYRRQLFSILQASADSAHGGNYTDAVEKAESGFFMYRDDFFNKHTDALETIPVRSALSYVDERIAAYKALEENLQSSVRSFSDAVHLGDVEKAHALFPAVQYSFGEFAELRNSIYRLGFELWNMGQSENATVSDASFLPFVSRFILGINTIADSGVLGAMNCEWDALTKHMEDEIRWMLIQNIDSFVYNLDAGAFTGENAFPEQKELSACMSFAELGKSINALYMLRRELDGTPEKSRFSNFGLSVDYGAALASRFSVLLDAGKAMTAERQKALSLPEPADYDRAAIDGKAYTDSLLASVEFIKSEAMKISQDNFELSPEARAYLGAQYTEDDEIIPFDTAVGAYRKFSGDAADFSRNTEIEVWQKIASYYAACGASYEAARSTDFANIEMLEGENFDEGVGTRLKYPLQTAEAAAAFQNALAANTDVLVSARTLLARGPYADTYALPLKRICDAITKLDSFAPKAQTVKTYATEQVNAARRAKDEADLRYEQAKKALSANDFAEARGRLQEARTKYNESLSYQESPELRKLSDERLASLGERIQTRQNEIVVRRVRDMKTKARNEYYNGNFSAAESVLTQAKALWAMTNIDEDEEITSLLALVGTALSLQAGRVLSPSAPLYPEMSQLLSIARQYFNEGQNLLKKGDTDAGKALLAQALQKIQELQLVYPRNRSASLLTLRIRQVLDPSGFASLFAERIEMAKANYKTPDKRQSAYTDLLDLYEIDPSYPGLAALIYETEIDLGIRRRPQDREAIARAASLTKQAQSVADSAGRDEVKLRAALSLVNEAISLDPNNNAALLLKDRIQIAIGGETLIVLSSEDEAKYQKAITALQSNDIVTANALVEELLQKPSNKNSSKIIDLQKKIRALL